MRNYIITSGDFGGMPSAGYAMEIVKAVSEYDAWLAIEFLGEFSDKVGEIEQTGEDGEIFIILDGDSSVCFSFNGYLFTNEKDFAECIDNTDFEYIPKIWRFFCSNEDWGLERIETLE